MAKITESIHLILGNCRIRSLADVLDGKIEVPYEIIPPFSKKYGPRTRGKTSFRLSVRCTGGMHEGAFSLL
ncbi:hypothetical protein NQ317_008869 [Molorchus minor]|uniref:Uncharacterized protein n=1 Tax=Molorchus minor TaxID=1323400 RepID=A0ABQ9J6K7_9CUCU|nr:hypothetical protein NQ317_008869 [Molorchus minor]